MKNYDLCILNQNGIVIDGKTFPNKKSVMAWISENLMALSLEGKSVSFYRNS